MKRFASTFSLAVALIYSVAVSANDNGPIVLDTEQLDNVNGGIAFAFGRADADAVGVYFSLTSSVTHTVAVSIYAGGLSASGSNSHSGSMSFAY